AVVGEDQLFLLMVPNRRGEGAMQAAEEFWTRTLVAVQQKLRVTMAVEDAAGRTQRPPLLFEIVNLAFHDGQQRAVLVRGWLCGGIDEAQRNAAQRKTIARIDMLLLPVPGVVFQALAHLRQLGGNAQTRCIAYKPKYARHLDSLLNVSGWRIE